MQKQMQLDMDCTAAVQRGSEEWSIDEIEGNDSAETIMT